MYKGEISGEISSVYSRQFRIPQNLIDLKNNVRTVSISPVNTST